MGVRGVRSLSSAFGRDPAMSSVASPHHGVRGHGAGLPNRPKRATSGGARCCLGRFALDGVSSCGLPGISSGSPWCHSCCWFRRRADPAGPSISGPGSGERSSGCCRSSGSGERTRPPWLGLGRHGFLPVLVVAGVPVLGPLGNAPTTTPLDVRRTDDVGRSGICACPCVDGFSLVLPRAHRNTDTHC